MISAKRRSAVLVQDKPRPSVQNITHVNFPSRAYVDFANFASTSLQSTLHTNLDAGQAVEYGAI